MKTTRAGILLAALALCGSAWTAAWSAPSPQDENATVAQIYYIKAKPGKLDEYNRYIREVAGPIDDEAQKHGAFLSLTTLISSKPDSPWTHMRIFKLRDREQLARLGKLLDEAKLRLEPDEEKRKARDAYAGTLRDFVGEEVVTILAHH